MQEKLLTMIAWRDGRAQLESRIRLIDGVLNLGFDIQCLYSVRIYVPTVPTMKGMDQGRTLEVRRAIPDSARISVDVGVQTTIHNKEMSEIMHREQIRPTTWKKMILRFFWLLLFVLYETRRERGQGGTVIGGVVDGGVVDGGVVDGSVVDGGVVDGGAVDGGITGANTDADRVDASANEGGGSVNFERTAGECNDEEPLQALVPVTIKYTLKVFSFD